MSIQGRKESQSPPCGVAPINIYLIYYLICCCGRYGFGAVKRNGENASGNQKNAAKNQQRNLEGSFHPLELFEREVERRVVSCRVASEP